MNPLDPTVSLCKRYFLVSSLCLHKWVHLYRRYATSQPATAEQFSPKGQVAKLVFDRAVNWLRLGCIPIGVIDGRPPPEKLARLKQRYGAHASSGNGGGQFRTLGDVALRVLRLLGLPAVEAPGEVRGAGEGGGRRGFYLRSLTSTPPRGYPELQAFIPLYATCVLNPAAKPKNVSVLQRE